MGFFGDVFEATMDVAKVISAPVVIVASVAKEVTGAVAKEVGEVVVDVKNTIKRGY